MHHTPPGPTHPDAPAHTGPDATPPSAPPDELADAPPPQDPAPHRPPRDTTAWVLPTGMILLFVLLALWILIAT